MERLLYTAVYELIEGGVQITFPNDELMSVVEETFDDALQSAREILALAVLDAEEEGREFKQTEVDENKLLPSQHLVSIDVWMPLERAKIKETYSKKTLTVPTWLDMLAKSKGINFSSVLTKALKKELGVRG